jgi:hypothetical protein
MRNLFVLGITVAIIAVAFAEMAMAGPGPV